MIPLWFQVQCSVLMSPSLISPNKTLPWAMPWFPNCVLILPQSPLSPSESFIVLQRFLPSSYPVPKVLLVWFFSLLIKSVSMMLTSGLGHWQCPSLSNSHINISRFLLILSYINYLVVGWTPFCVPNRTQDKALYRKAEMVIELIWSVL